MPISGLKLPNGIFLPKHTKVGIFRYTIHFNKEIYSEDAEISTLTASFNKAEKTETNIRNESEL